MGAAKGRLGWVLQCGEIKESSDGGKCTSGVMLHGVLFNRLYVARDCRFVFVKGCEVMKCIQQQEGLFTFILM